MSNRITFDTFGDRVNELSKQNRGEVNKNDCKRQKG